MHEYFKRKSSEWSILNFLEECGIEEFKQKIEAYLTSLKAIADTQESKRNKRAKKLLNNYKKASVFLAKNIDKKFGGMAERLWVLVSFKSLGRATKLML